VTITPEQCKAARKLLGMSQISLAKAAHLNRTTIIAFEIRQSTMGRNNIDAIRRALEAAGVEFGGEEPGVRLK
jgi:transcriptional regulator with XRE-family HTH domain